MIKESVKSASTIEDAKAAALLELGLTEDDVYNIEVLQMPQKKTFGIFGGKPAEVKVWVDVPEKKEKPVSEKNTYKKPASYIAEIVKGLGLPECSVKTFADDEEIVFELDCGDDYGIVIGRRGETLDAIQYLARMVANRGVSGYKRVSINIGNYREKRKGALVSLAKKDAARAVRTGRNITLEPMNPYERRIIHTAVQEVEGATSFSVGQDLDRRVVIAPENGGKGSYGDRNYRRGRGGRNDRRPKREPYVPQVAPDREQKNDAAGVSVYGKIEIKKNTEE
ncbi:MAG: RNA-binding cell elongation regulator Jag/EloR [Acutalibacteraceae bacterium]